MPKIAQIRRPQFNDEEIGMRFNNESGLGLGSALEGFVLREDATPPGQKVSSSLTIVARSLIDYFESWMPYLKEFKAIRSKAFHNNLSRFHRRLTISRQLFIGMEQYYV
jgi:hypothetical protein